MDLELPWENSLIPDLSNYEWMKFSLHQHHNNPVRPITLNVEWIMKELLPKVKQWGECITSAGKFIQNLPWDSTDFEKQVHP